MTPIAILCFVLALLLAGSLFVNALQEAIRFAYKRGYERGFSNCEKWITEQGSQVDKEREKIWRAGQ